MKLFTLKALPLATAAALAMTSHSLSALPLVSVNAGVNASATSSINSTALAPLSGTHNVSVGHTINAVVSNPSSFDSSSGPDSSSGSDNPSSFDATLQSIMSELQGDDGEMATLPGLPEGDSSNENEGASADVIVETATNAVAIFEGDLGSGESGDSDSNALVETTSDATAEVTAALEKVSSQEPAQEPAQEPTEEPAEEPAQEPEVADKDELIDAVDGEATDDSGNQAEAPSSNDVFAAAAADAQADGEAESKF